jgi:hypothetical protein
MRAVHILLAAMVIGSFGGCSGSEKGPSAPVSHPDVHAMTEDEVVVASSGTAASTVGARIRLGP